jgi:hypothetical protein
MSDLPLNKTLTITFEVQQWNLIIQFLAEGPYKIVQPLIQAIGQQAATQTQLQEPALQQPVVGNGSDRYEEARP